MIEGIIVFIGALLTKGWFSTFLYISAYLLIGYKVILKALKNIGRKDFLDENLVEDIKVEKIRYRSYYCVICKKKEIL